MDCEVYYRPDTHACWLLWHAFQLCATRDCRDFDENPCLDNGYPQELFCEQDAIPVALPRPKPYDCITTPLKGMTHRRPSTQGYQFQVKLVTKGWCRVRGLLLHALWREKAPWQGIACTVPPAKL